VRSLGFGITYKHTMIHQLHVIIILIKKISETGSDCPPFPSLSWIWVSIKAVCLF
jgi:hypothetical protein